MADTVTYVKEGNVITKTFVQRVLDVEAEKNALNSMKYNVESAILDSEGNATRALTAEEQELINQYTAALIVLNE